MNFVVYKIRMKNKMERDGRFNVHTLTHKLARLIFFAENKLNSSKV